MSQRPSPSPCADQVRRADPDRHLTALYAPERAREDLFALYALNDELARAAEVSDEPLIGAMRLQWWRDTLAAIAAGGEAPRHPVAEAVALAQARRPWDQGAIERLIAARESLLGEVRPADMKALEALVEGTAGTLAAMGLGILGVDDAASLQAARHGATAYGLVGTLRSVPIAAPRRRVLLPVTVMEGERLAMDDIAPSRAGGALGRVVASVAELAEAHVLAARTLRGRSADTARSVLLWTTLAAADLGTLRRVGYDPFDPTFMRGGPFRRLAVTWRAATGRF